MSEGNSDLHSGHSVVIPGLSSSSVLVSVLVAMPTIKTHLTSPSPLVSHQFKSSPNQTHPTPTPTPTPVVTEQFTAHTNATTSAAEAVGHAALDFIKHLLEKIPLPLPAVYAIFAIGIFLILLCCVCICCKCCCKKDKKKQKKGNKIDLGGVRSSTGLIESSEAEVDYGATKQYRGKMLYSLEYNAAQSVLTVGIKQASSLKAMDLGGSSDPYVKVYTVPDKTKICETKVFKTTLNPVFNEQFNFPMSKSNLLKSTAVMQVYDFDRFSKHDLIGELRVELCSVDWNHVIEEWEDLAEPAKFEEENLGEICFSLRYVPTAGKLTVVLLEARDLKSMDIGGSSDPYVKVQLALDKRKWKKRKTSVKKKTLNPYYNESFTFDVSFEQIQRVTLVISVWDHDAVSRNDAMGKIYLGCDASGNQLRHWADMLSNPRRPVAQWHNLLTAQQVNSTLTLKKRMPLPF